MAMRRRTKFRLGGGVENHGFVRVESLYPFLYALIQNGKRNKARLKLLGDIAM